MTVSVPTPQAGNPRLAPPLNAGPSPLRGEA